MHIERSWLALDCLKQRIRGAQGAGTPLTSAVERRREEPDGSDEKSVRSIGDRFSFLVKPFSS